MAYDGNFIFVDGEDMVRMDQQGLDFPIDFDQYFWVDMELVGTTYVLSSAQILEGTHQNVGLSSD